LKGLLADRVLELEVLKEINATRERVAVRRAEARYTMTRRLVPAGVCPAAGGPTAAPGRGPSSLPYRCLWALLRPLAYRSNVVWTYDLIRDALPTARASNV